MLEVPGNEVCGNNQLSTFAELSSWANVKNAHCKATFCEVAIGRGTLDVWASLWIVIVNYMQVYTSEWASQSLPISVRQGTNATQTHWSIGNDKNKKGGLLRILCKNLRKLWIFLWFYF